MFNNPEKCDGPGSKMSRTNLLSAVFFIVILLLNLIPPLLYYWRGSMNQDLAQTIYNARELVIGRLPYKDIVSHHFLLYLAPFAVVEWLVGLSAESVAVMHFCFHILVVYFVYRLARHLSADANVSKIAAFLMSTVGWFPEISLDFNYQSILMPLFCLYLWNVLANSQARSGLLVATSGVLAGLLVLCDQRTLIFGTLGVIPLLACDENGKVKNFVNFGLSFCLPIVAGILWIAWIGALNDFIFQTIEYPLLYRNAGIRSSLPKLSFALLEYAHTTVVPIIFFWPAILLIFVKERISFRFKFLIAGFFLSIVFVFLGGRSFFNYLLYLGLFGVLGVCTFFEDSGKRRYNCMLAFLMIPLLYSYSAFLVGVTAKSQDPSPRFRLVDYIKSHTSASDNILVWGYCPQVYNESQRFSSFRDMSLLSIGGSVFHFSGNGTGNVVPEFLGEFKDYLQGSPPRLVVASIPSTEDRLEHGLGCIWGGQALDNRFGIGFFREMLAKDYRLVISSWFGDVQVGVYERLG